jgi:hypothetical protein
MPTITNPGVIEALSMAFLQLNCDQGAAMQEIGYSKNYSTTGNCSKLFARPDVIAGIKQARLDLVAKTGFSKAEAHLELDENRQLALDMKQPSAATGASVAKMRLYGYDQADMKRDSTVIVINPPRPAAKPVQATTASPVAIEAEVVFGQGQA